MKLDIQKVANIGELAKNYKWRLTFEKFPAGIETDVKADDLAIRCISSTLPKRTEGSTKIRIHEFQAWDYNFPTFSDSIQLVFLDTIDGKALNFFYAWKNAIFDMDTGIQLPKSLISGLATLTRLDKSTAPRQVYTLHNAVAFDLDETPFGSEETDYQLTLTLKYDWYTMKQAK